MKSRFKRPQRTPSDSFHAPDICSEVTTSDLSNEDMHRIVIMNQVTAQFCEHSNAIISKIGTVRSCVESLSTEPAVEDDLVDYVASRHQILTAYCECLLFYTNLKCKVSQVNDHPVFRRLLELRFIVEKMRPIDGKLRHQIDRVLRQSVYETRSESYDTVSAPSHQESSYLKPSIQSMLTEESDEDDTAGSVSNTLQSDGASNKYTAPKMVAMHFEDTERRLDKARTSLERRQKKLKYSELMESMREEFGAQPESYSSSGIATQSSMQRKEKEKAEDRRNFEETHMRRLVLSREDKKAMKRARREAGRFDNLVDVGNVTDFDSLVRETEAYNRSESV